MAASSKDVRRRLGVSLHGWENSMVVFLIIAGGFALLAGVATWAVVRLQRIEIAESNEALERYKIDAGKALELIKAEAARANESSEKLKNETARLSAEAETARKETVNAQLQLQQIQFPRRLDSDKLKAGIAGMPPQFFEVLYDQSAADGSGLAFEIFVTLASVGWKTDQKLPAPLTPQQGPDNLRDVYQLLPLTKQSGGANWGVSVVTKGPISDDPTTPERILGNALLTAVASPIQTVGGGKDEMMPAGKIRVIVGPKLP